MKHEIEIPDMPEGYRAVAFRCPSSIDELIFIRGKVITKNNAVMGIEQLIVEKIKPRRIVLEETDEIRSVRDGEWYINDIGNFCNFNGKSSINKFSIWREVKEGEE